EAGGWLAEIALRRADANLDSHLRREGVVRGCDPPRLDGRLEDSTLAPVGKRLRLEGKDASACERCERTARRGFRRGDGGGTGAGVAERRALLARGITHSGQISGMISCRRSISDSHAHLPRSAHREPLPASMADEKKYTPIEVFCVLFPCVMARLAHPRGNRSARRRPGRA